MRPPRLLLPHTVTMLTSRVQEGLPFTCTPIISMIVLSAMALAQKHHPVRIVGFVVMSNHVHIIVKVEDPDTIVSFMERLKTETAHAMNKLRGRRQRTLWCEGYDSPVILTKEDLFKKLAYVYLNPVKANLVDSISHYPGVSSWEMLVSGRTELKVKRIRRTLLGKLRSNHISIREQQQVARELEERSDEELTLSIEPDAWTECFEGEETPAEFHARLLAAIADGEEELRRARSKPVKGVDALLREPFFKPYDPKIFCRRMWCICSDLKVRKAFVLFVRDLREQAREVLRRWRGGDFSIRFPIGLFPPSLPRHANAVPPYLTL